MYSYCITEFADWPVVIEIDSGTEPPTAEIVYGGHDGVSYEDCRQWVEDMS